jgi:hypothetical protein
MSLQNNREKEFEKIEQQREERANHFLGVAGLLLFLKDTNHIDEVESPLITFPIEALDSLYLCLPKTDVHPSPILGFNERIWQWMSKISFKGIIIEKDYIILLTNNVHGDAYSADFNPIGIKIITQQISNIADQWKAMDLALVWNGYPSKSTTKRISVIENPAKEKSLEDWLIENQKGSSQLELTLRRIRTQNAYNNVPFKGEVHINSEFKKLVDPFDPTKVPKVESGKYYDE